MVGTSYAAARGGVVYLEGDYGEEWRWRQFGRVTVAWYKYHYHGTSKMDYPCLVHPDSSCLHWYENRQPR